MGKTMTNIGFLMLVAGVFLVVSPYNVAGAIVIVIGFFVAVAGRMAT